MAGRLDWRALGKGALWVLGVALVGGLIGLGIWYGRQWPAKESHVAAGVAMGAIVGLLYALSRGRIAWKKINVHLPFVGELEGEKTRSPPTQRFILERSQRAVGWKIYVELVGRIATQPVAQGTGTLRGSLNSFHALLQNVRRYLGEAAPQAPPRRIAGSQVHTLETLTVWIMTEVRQLLASWHHKLEAHEGPKVQGRLPPPDDDFGGKEACEQAIAALQERLRGYATAMAELLDVSGPESFNPPARKPTAEQPPPPPSASAPVPAPAAEQAVSPATPVAATTAE